MEKLKGETGVIIAICLITFLGVAGLLGVLLLGGTWDQAYKVLTIIVPTTAGLLALLKSSQAKTTSEATQQIVSDKLSDVVDAVNSVPTTLPATSSETQSIG